MKDIELRDHFAITILQGLLSSNKPIKDGATNEDIAKVAYSMADAMLKQRENK